MKLSIYSYLKEKSSKYLNKIKELFKPEPERKLRVRSNGKVDLIRRKIKIQRFWTNQNNGIPVRKTIFKYRRKKKKYGILRYKRRKPIKQKIQKHKPLPIEEPKRLRKKKKRFVLAKTYIRLRKFNKVFKVFWYRAPFFKSVEIHLFKYYKRVVLDEATRKRKILSDLSNQLSTKDIDRLMELHLSNSHSNVFATVRKGYIQERKKTPLIRASSTKKNKKKMNTLLRRRSRNKKGYDKFITKICISYVVLKLTPAILKFPGSKKLTNYAREQTLLAAGTYLQTSQVIFLRIVSSHSRIRAFRRRKIFRPILKRYKGFVLSYNNTFRRPHGFIRQRKQKRI